MTLRLSPAPYPAHRLIPSRFPPIGLFDTVSTAADLEAVMELAGWTNDRLVAERILRLPETEWAYGRANASIVMAAFLHVAPGGSRFNGPDLGAWYAAAELMTAVAEVGHHLRREAVDRNVPDTSRVYRNYQSRLDGDFVDIIGEADIRADLYAPDSYGAAQAWSEGLRAEGRDGVVYDSVRHAGGINAAAYRPSKVLDVVQAEHLQITVQRDERRIDVRRLDG